MSILLQTLDSKTADQLANLGNGSNKINTAGAHLLTLTAVYEFTAANYSAIVIEGMTKDGQELKHMEFLGKPEDDTQAEIDKAQGKNERTAAMLARLAKAAGFKSIKDAVAAHTTETDEKGTKTIFTKFAKKQVTIVTTTEIQPNKDGDKAFAVQVLDTMKFLDKSGKDGMGREVLEAYATEAKTKLEIKFGKDNNPACIKKFNEMKEKALGIAPQAAPTPQAAPVTGGMPSAAPQPTVAAPVTTEVPDI